MNILIGRKSISGAGPKDFVAWIKAQGDKANPRTVVLGRTVTCAP